MKPENSDIPWRFASPGQEIPLNPESGNLPAQMKVLTSCIPVRIGTPWDVNGERYVVTSVTQVDRKTEVVIEKMSVFLARTTVRLSDLS